MERKITDLDTGKPLVPGGGGKGGGGQFNIPREPRAAMSLNEMRAAKGLAPLVKQGRKLRAKSGEKGGQTTNWKEGYYDYEPGGKPASSHPEYMRGWNESANED